MRQPPLKSVPFVRDSLPIPKDFSPVQVKLWMQLENGSGTFAIGDQIGLVDGIKFPDPMDTSWSSVYPLAIMLLERQANTLSFAQKRNSYSSINPSEVYAEFAKSRIAASNKYRQYLLNWGLESVLVQEATRPSEMILDSDEEKVLGLHKFANRSEVQRYITNWSHNPILPSVLRAHRAVVSDAMDLICCELLDNGFRYGRSNVIIIAKLCSSRSSARALKIHGKRPYLTELEVQFFEWSVMENAPLLQVIIADSGGGFGKNQALNDLYKARIGGEPPKEFELINFALRPEISTRPLEDFELDYQNLSESFDIETSIHGLSEVKSAIHSLRGFWRIHSNSTIVDHCSFPNSANNDTQILTGRTVPGCLHYIVLPLGSNLAAPSSQSNVVKSSELCIVDVAETILARPEVNIDQINDADWITGIEQVRERLVCELAKKNSLPILLNVSVLNNAPHSVAKRVAWMVADIVTRCIRSRAVFVCGAKEHIRSYLRRYFGFSKKLFSRRIIPFVDFYLNDLEIAIDIEGGFQITNQLKSIVLEALLPYSYHEFQKSEHKPYWADLEQIAKDNPFLFSVRFISGGSDELFEGRVKINPEDSQTKRFLIGARSSRAMFSQLERTGAISNRPLMRLGKIVSNYIHVGRLLSDQNIMISLNSWLLIVMQSLDCRLKVTPGPTNEIELLAIMHPAIEIAHLIAGTTRFRGITITEITRYADLRWDSELLSVTGKKNIVCLFDMVSKGDTLNLLSESLAYLEAEILAVISVISFSDFVQNNKIPFYSFSVLDRVAYDQKANAK